MSLFEWLGESLNPGPTGNIDTNKEPLFKKPPKRGWAVFLMIIGLALSLLSLMFISRSENKISLLIFFLFYLAIAYFVTPRPDTSNVGWLGGLIDHPFRISDDWNRFLVFLNLFLLPRKLILFALQAFHRLIKYYLK